MPVRPYEDTSLWKATLGGAKRGAHSQLKQELAQAYRKFRERAAELTNDIHGQLPNLTVHNVEHLDALWDVASIIAGEKYPLNPLEAFVLGGAILIHDAGMVLAAFDGGLDEVKKNDRWRDNLLAALKRHGIEEPTETDFEKPPRDAEHEAIFDVLRQVHADKAKELHRKVWQNPGSGYGQRLIDDTRLLEDYGELIGLIAASHHWDVNSLTRRLPSDPVAASNPYPREWTVDAIKIACMLRCADAANIDESRAPSFIYAMRRPDKISKQHWHFQNRLRPARLEKDALVFRSKTAFRYPSEATEGKDFETQAWWLCHDAIQEVERQLSLSDALLRDTGRRPFAARRVAGADSPDRLTAYIEVDGWRPVDTSVKVTDVVHLVEMLGGKQLYGDDPIVPLRELMQNAADAIRARRFVDPNFERGKPEHERGCILVEVRDDPDDNDKFWLIVEDDGVGMSERVMTGPLLDFGKSFWRSPMAAEIFPGLSSNKSFEPTGRFGIGFYSIFMYADYARVTSRPLDIANSNWGQARTLEFSHGLARRALLRKYRAYEDGQLAIGAATRVSIRLPRTIMTQWRAHPLHDVAVRSLGPLAAELGFSERLQSLVLGLNCRVDVSESSQPRFNVHSGDGWKLPADEFLWRLYCVGHDDRARKTISVHGPFLSNYGFEEYVMGRASLMLLDELQGYSAYSVGGFTRFNYGYHCGLLLGAPETAAREASCAIPESSLKKWRDCQVESIAASGLTAGIKAACIGMLVYFPGFNLDPLMFLVRFGGEIVSLSTLRGKLLSGESILMPIINLWYIASLSGEFSVEGRPKIRVNLGEFQLSAALYFAYSTGAVSRVSLIGDPLPHHNILSRLMEFSWSEKEPRLIMHSDMKIGEYEGCAVCCDVLEVWLPDVTSRHSAEP